MRNKQAIFPRGFLGMLESVAKLITSQICKSCVFHLQSKYAFTGVEVAEVLYGYKLFHGRLIFDACDKSGRGDCKRFC